MFSINVCSPKRKSETGMSKTSKPRTKNPSNSRKTETQEKYEKYRKRGDKSEGVTGYNLDQSSFLGTNSLSNSLAVFYSKFFIH